MSEGSFWRVAILGVGLMGASLGLALRAKGLAQEVVGYDLSEQMLQCALERGAISEGTTNLLEAVKGADLVVFAVPVEVMPALMERVVPALSPNTLLTDLGSTKQRIVTEGARLFGAQFVGGHPMAGSEESGARAGRADLFQGAAWILTPSHPLSSVERLKALVTALGARPFLLEAEEHDRMVALVSHLPHALSFSFSKTVRELSNPTLAESLAGSSYRDMIRVAASSPQLWSGIFLENREALLTSIITYQQSLQRLQEILESQNREALLELLQLFSKAG